MNGRFVSYLRVSTDRQGRSGLGIEAQRQAVEKHLNGGNWELLAEFVEVESGKRSDRPQLAKALAHCRRTGSTLIVAKLDRLARNAQFLLTVVNQSGENGVVCCDLPAIPSGAVGKFMLTQMAAVAELEAGLISQRTKAALAVARSQGKKLGGFRGHTVDQSLAVRHHQEAADAFAGDIAPIARELRDNAPQPSPDRRRANIARHPDPTRWEVVGNHCEEPARPSRGLKLDAGATRARSQQRLQPSPIG